MSSADITCIVGIIEILWVMGEVFLAYKDGMLTRSQFQSKYPGKQGIPFLWHGGMWGDFFLINPLICYVVFSYRSQWTQSALFWATITGCIISVAAHIAWARGNTCPDSLIWREEITFAGMIHLFYTIWAMMIFLLFFFASSNVGPIGFAVVSVLLTIHLILGTHLVLNGIKQKFRIDWLPESLARTSESTVSIAIFVFTLITGWRLQNLWYGFVTFAACLLVFRMILRVMFLILKVPYYQRYLPR